VAVLEPGVALLVKVLPLIGVRSVLSCDGNANGRHQGSTYTTSITFAGSVALCGT
jgi:hypothetical protein